MLASGFKSNLRHVHILGIHIHHWLFLSLLALPLLERASKTPRPEAKVSLPHIELLIRGQDLGSPSGDGQVQLGTEGEILQVRLQQTSGPML